MPDNQRTYSPKITASPTWSTEKLQVGEQRIVRKVINSAIYVEKAIMPPLRKKSPIFTNDDDDYTTRTITTDRSVKRCTCITSPKNCPGHHVDEPKSAKSSSETISDSSSSSDDDSQITVKSKKVGDSLVGSELRLSLSSLNTDRTNSVSAKEKDEVIKSWLQKKDKERKKRELAEAKAKAAREREKELMLEKERENFKKWLANKKQQEERMRKEKERKEREKQLKEAERDKNQKEIESSYNSWLKRKKRAELEKKIKDKLAILQIYEEKQRRMEENQRSFNEWLKNSQNKPKPIPLNKGLESLCSSTSITYINPVPWIPNVERSQKPSSQ